MNTIAAAELTIEALLLEATGLLRASSPSARLDAELLLAFTLERSRVSLHSNFHEVIGAGQTARFRSAVARRSRHEPVAYITGEREFFGLSFVVTPGVLVPRPETELLVERALQRLSDPRRNAKIAERGMPLRILDCGTGSGCIAVALGAELRRLGIRADITALDRDPIALDIAKRNVERHGLTSMITLLRSDWFSALDSAVQRFDCILSNPPYVALASTGLDAELRHEPAGALYAGSDGLSDIRKLLGGFLKFLRRPGLFLCEIAHDQRAAVQSICAELLRADRIALAAAESPGSRYYHPAGEVAFWNDLAGLARLLELEIQ